MKAKRALLIGVAVILVALIAGAVGYAIRMRPQAELGVAYGARVACACRYIGGRSLENCRNDFEPGMELVSLSEDGDARRVTARVPLLARRSAQFREGMGCLLEPLPAG